MNCYRVLQLTNSSVGAVATSSTMPFGTITRRVQNAKTCATFGTVTSGADTVYLNETGNYNVTYSASLVAEAAGIVSAALSVNGTQVYTVSATAAAAGDTVNITLPYQIRVCSNGVASANVPATVQIVLTGGDVTGGTSNLIVEKVY
jgi:hypothetical protein